VIGAVLLYFFARSLNMAPLPEWGARTVALVAQISAFAAKTLFWCWVFIWVRWSLPRFRYDQLMRLGWKNMIPLSFLNIAITAVVLLHWTRISHGRGSLLILAFFAVMGGVLMVASGTALGRVLAHPLLVRAGRPVRHAARNVFILQIAGVQAPSWCSSSSHAAQSEERGAG
jgi:hypothetical protein